MPKTIKRLDRNTVKTLKDELDAALESVLAKHGLKAELGRITFSPTDFRCKLNVAINSGPVTSRPNAVADTDPAEQRKFEQYARKFGLTGKEFGKTFEVRGTPFTIIKINPRAKIGGYPVIAKNARGTKYKFDVETAKTAV